MLFELIDGIRRFLKRRFKQRWQPIKVEPELYSRIGREIEREILEKSAVPARFLGYRNEKWSPNVRGYVCVWCGSPMPPLIKVDGVYQHESCRKSYFIARDIDRRLEEAKLSNGS